MKKVRNLRRQTSYKEYFSRKYGWDIKENNQPMLISIHLKTGNQIVLVPELCQMTGLSDSMRANFRLMKDMS
jgi:aubergine-like protein